MDHNNSSWVYSITTNLLSNLLCRYNDQKTLRELKLAGPVRLKEVAKEGGQRRWTTRFTNERSPYRVVRQRKFDRITPPMILQVSRNACFPWSVNDWTEANTARILLSHRRCWWSMCASMQRYIPLLDIAVMRLLLASLLQLSCELIRSLIFRKKSKMNEYLNSWHLQYGS